MQPTASSYRLRDKVVPSPPSTVDGAAPPAEPQVPAGEGGATVARQKPTDAVSVDDAHASVGCDIDGAAVEAVSAEVGVPS
jgi:hypothetical protein